MTPSIGGILSANIIWVYLNEIYAVIDFVCLSVYSVLFCSYLLCWFGLLAIG
jgi:hypothetical protein